jgi:aminoglycoside 3-N-acetyltransferase
VHVQSALWTVGPADGAHNVDELGAFYLRAFQEVLGPAGTLSVLTAFEDYGRYGTPFVREESPSRSGMFSEYVRTRPGAVRSMHPINSVTALGARAEELCGGAHFEGCGYESPWGRLHRMNAKLLNIGVRFGKVLSFVHYIEAQYGVPYNYIKLYRTPVITNGSQVEGTFSMSVRYRDFSIAYSFQHFERELFAAGAAIEVPLGRSLLHVTAAARAFDIGVRCLNENRYSFLSQPPRFRPGEIPADGFTGPSQPVYEAAGPNVARAPRTQDSQL